MPRLYIAALPIDGNWRSLDPRIVEVVKKCDLLIAEEKKNALRLLAAVDERGKRFILINEHSSDDDRKEAVENIQSVSNTVFVSDAGTPCIADPDYRVVDMCISNGVEIMSIPGPCSITAALSVSGFDTGRFMFLGFPPRQGSERKKFFSEIEKSSAVVVFLERPYSLKQTLSDMFSITRMMSLSMNLGDEVGSVNIRGTAAMIISKTEGMKGAFTIVVDKP